MPIKPPLKEIFYTADNWFRHDAAALCSPEIGGKVNYAYAYTPEEFAEIHPNLAVVLFKDFEALPTSSIKEAIAYWDGRKIVLPFLDPNTHKIFGTCRVKEFEKFENDTRSNDVVVTFTRYETGECSDGIVYPYREFKNLMVVSRKWLDEHMPKWEERYVIAESLGLEPAALTKFLFEDSPELSVDIPSNLDL